MIDFSDFVPHPAEALAEGVFPKPLDPFLYGKMVEKFEKVDDVTTSRITYESDGLAITGIACVPKDHTGKLPLMVFNRGGSRRYGMLTVVQVLRLLVPLARKGYIVLSTNYRGNDGGEGQEEFGGSDVRDVLKLLELGKELSEYDGENAFLAGWSRGGMMSYLALREGAEVKAGASVAGLADLRCTEDQKPEMYERVYKPLIAHENEDALQVALAERSAVCWPEMIDVPLLLQHGDADAVVPVDQSQRLAESLSNAEYIEYAGGDHFLNRDMDTVLENIHQFFLKHRS